MQEGSLRVEKFEKDFTADSETEDEEKASNHPQTMNMKCMAKSKKCIQCQSNPIDLNKLR